LIALTTLDDFLCNFCFLYDDSTIKLWNLETQAEIATLKGHSESITCLLFSPDNKTLISGSSNNYDKIPYE